WNLISFESMGLGVTIFSVILCSASMVYLKSGGFKQSKESLVFVGIIALSSLNFSLFDNILIKSLNFIFLSLCFVYWICIYTQSRLENRISLYLISDMLHQLFVIPFCNFTCCFSGIKQVFVKNQKGKGILSGLAGILFFLPVLILVVTLLTDADAAFEGLMDRVQISFSENMLEYIRQLVFGLPVACYLYGLIYGNRYHRNTGHMTLDSVNKNLIAFRFAPDVTVYSALTALNLVYAVFFLAQAAYLFSAFGDSLPQSMTYAEYARRGFFELCAVSGINLAVIAAAHLIVKRDKIKILHGETAILCLFTMALIVTAISKMGMYINYYGLTRLRVYTSWFMVVLFFLFIIVLLRQFKEFHGTRIAVIGFLCFFLVLCYGNADGMIAKYNIDRYQSGTLESLDIEALSDLSDAAVPHLYELYQKTADPVLKDDLREVIIRRPYWSNDKANYQESFRDFNLQTYQAEQIRKKI
ncbi:MAG: DUF4173 domain-containing protein, partial [Bacillota bacterium]